MKIKEGGGMDIKNNSIVTDADTELLDSQITQISNDFAETYYFDNEQSEELEMLVAKAMRLGELYERKKWQAAKAQAVPEWISVEDRLPKKGEMVYGYAAKHNYTCPVVFNGKKFYNEGLADNSISHWHYLAKPMKAQEPAND